MAEKRARLKAPRPLRERTISLLLPIGLWEKDPDCGLDLDPSNTASRKEQGVCHTCRDLASLTPGVIKT
jgi:hypothetical protein